MKELLDKAFKLNRVERVQCKGKTFELEQVCTPIEDTWYDKNGIIVFNYKADSYVIQYSEEFVKVLNSYGFVRKLMYVPFSDRCIPIDRVDEYELKLGISA